MIKSFILISLIAVAFSFTFFGRNFFQNLLNHENLHVGDYIEKGTAITPTIQSQIKNFTEQAYIFNGNNTVKNVLFIQQQMNNLYPGNWVVSIYGPYNSNATDPILGTNVGIASSSSQGQWWIYWKGVNHYQPSQAYYFSKQDGNNTNYTCLSNNNYSSYSDIYQNIVNAAEIDFHDIQNFTAQVQYYLHGYSLDTSPTVTAVNNSVPFFMCAWGSSSYNSIQRTGKLNFTVVSTPRIG